MPATRKSDPIVVKRYAGSRLYDTDAGGYVTLSQLRAWAARKLAFTVIDAESGADITRVVLA